MRRIRMIVEYDGTDLHGWQRQQSLPTVQGHLEDAFQAMTNTSVEIGGASRTDAGVHAKGQVCAFSTEMDIPTHGFLRGLNTYLPASVAVREVTEVAPEFNPRFDSTAKHYQYTLFSSRIPSPLQTRFAWHVPYELDVGKMNQAGKCLQGEHDFASFQGHECQAKTTFRRISRTSITKSGEFVIIDIEGNAFLRNMVRIVVGTLVEVGRGKVPPAAMNEILRACDRQAAGPTAPPNGLCLRSVTF